MKDFCVDLEIAKELKKEGFPQESENWWLENINSGKIEFNITQYPTGSKTYYAPTSDEILKELPHKLNGSWLRITPVGKGYEVGYWEHEWNKEESQNDVETRKIYEHYLDKKLSNALSNLWLYLKKEGLLNEKK